ncbi:BQ5605_C023g09759 [Microbotryum silenes-dioicae]|uniref:BQ5605_C023g09759 protein n=1 Tax=Microbotryum silenes-dioicae TaxID=796604 RepID=A0A2X0PL26_9BASI|nr:BQ5605_C023g09759 [Microbotryum silenes-dioicae]
MKVYRRRWNAMEPDSEGVEIFGPGWAETLGCGEVCSGVSDGEVHKMEIGDARGEFAQGVEEAGGAREEYVGEILDWAEGDKANSSQAQTEEKLVSVPGSVTLHLLRKLGRDRPRISRDQRPLREDQQRQLFLPISPQPILQIIRGQFELFFERFLIGQPFTVEEDEGVEVAGPADDGDLAQGRFESDDDRVGVVGEVGEGPDKNPVAQGLVIRDLLRRERWGMS